MASFMRGASARHPGEALAGLEGQQGRGQAWSSPWHHQLSQAAPEGRAGLPCPPGNQQRTRRQVEGVDPFRAVNGDLQAFSSRLSGCTPFWEIQPTLSRPAYIMLLSRHKSLLVGVGIPWHPTSGSSGHKGSSIPQCPHCSPTSTGLWVPGPGVGWRGVGEEHSPEGQRVLSRACQPPSSGREPPGPTINISSVGGILRPP